ncbi:phosphoesterase, RecJ domain protein [Staphylothermus marinus F1]|uniref:Phosphoesterase, RecJ domain protein n=1 Tax=Staphylothermus marinus (strain ATCC 43588 / DSM 3639 / JCM 9404 / F1) TaxID=399550 RepID=A3DNS6_STAMF|nr:phosphoesterase [Staphylothermus marinus]ABN70286.1 phosphoesterase, RecJ domain protein [Staphylothermus marinus F1]
MTKTSKNIARVFVGGDWDADGVVAAALIVYSQEKLGMYPLKAKAIVDKKPVDPEKLKFIIGNFRGNYDLVILLDLPYTDTVPRVLKIIKQHFGVKKIMYIDHHLSTLTNKEKLKEVVDELIIDRRMPTAGIVEKLLVENGISIHSRLKSFVEVVKYMDSGKKVPQKYLKLFQITSMFSKALTAIRDEDLWVKIVDWLASPSPLPMPLSEGVMKKVKKIIEIRDKEIKEKALDLALSAVKIGELRFIDARSVWKHRGGTALASKISSILKAPVAVLIDTNKNYSLLIIKAPRGKAYRIAKFLIGEGLALDIAGHPNLAIVKIKKDPDKKVLIDKLREAEFYI